MSSESSKYIIQYENTSALFAGQTIVHAGTQEVIVDFATGPVPGAERAVLPVHTRIALTREAAQRLARLLQQATQPAASGEARLPGT